MAANQRNNYLAAARKLLATATQNHASRTSNMDFLLFSLHILLNHNNYDN